MIQTLAQADAALPEGGTTARKTIEQIDAAIAADLNTAQLLAVLQDTLREPELGDAERRIVVAACDSLLGLGLDRLTADEITSHPSVGDLDADTRTRIEQLIAERTMVRAAKDWLRADAIRAELDTLGVHITDTPTGPTWTLK